MSIFKGSGVAMITPFNDDLTVDCSGDVVVKNENITSLTNGIFSWGQIGGGFNCSFCGSLKSLDGAPKEVGGDFHCYGCKYLKSLDGAPKVVNGNFDCSDCPSLNTLEGAPKEVGGNFNCLNCKILFTKNDIKKVSNVKKDIIC